MVVERQSGGRVSSFRTNFSSYLKEFCTTITIRRTTETKDSMGRVTNTSTTTSTANADIQWVTKKNIQYINSGRVEIGDGRVYVEYDTDLKVNDEITFNGQYYKIYEQFEGEVVLGDVIYLGFLMRKNAQS
jgi:head-tail adaptor